MQQLSGLDAAFHHLETPEMPMHVGALHVFELPAGARGKFVTRLRQHINTRLPYAPALRRRVWSMPLNLANPAWVDADPDLSQHIVEIKLPPSAKLGDGLAALEAAVSQLHPALLERSRPLWKMHVLEGLAPAPNGCRRVGLYTQLHHAAVDGQAAVALAQVLLDLQPEGREMPVKPSKRSKVFKLGWAEMLRAAIATEAQQVVQIVKQLPGTVSTLAGAAAVGIVLACVAVLAGRMGAIRARLKSQRIDLERALERIGELATRDDLTGLTNRRHMTALMQSEQAHQRRGDSKMTIALLDIDLFKRINDTFGHPAGDAVLRAFAESSRKVLRATDVLARWGGEEFLLMLPGTAPEQSLHSVEPLRESLAQISFDAIQPGLKVTFSAGFSACDDECSIEACIERADQAMYRAKTQGRNCSVLA